MKLFIFLCCVVVACCNENPYRNWMEKNPEEKAELETRTRWQRVKDSFYYMGQAIVAMEKCYPDKPCEPPMVCAIKNSVYGYCINKLKRD